MNRSVSYFTTELSAATVVLPEKKGSGLDQELRHEFVRRNKGGGITVESKPDQGTSFTMVFNQTKPAS